MRCYIIGTIVGVMIVVSAWVFVWLKAKEEDRRVKKMSPEERRKYQEEMRKHQM